MKKKNPKQHIYLGPTYRSYSKNDTVRCYLQRIRNFCDEHQKALLEETQRPTHTFSIQYTDRSDLVNRDRFHNKLLKEFKYVNHLRFEIMNGVLKGYYELKDEQIVTNSSKRSYGWLFIVFILLLMTLAIQVLVQEGWISLQDDRVELGKQILGGML